MVLVWCVFEVWVGFVCVLVLCFLVWVGLCAGLVCCVFLGVRFLGLVWCVLLV